MSEKIYKLVINKKEFEIPHFQFSRMSQISLDIFQTLVKELTYTVETVVPEKTFEEFILYLKSSSEPKINFSNYHDFSLLNQEFKIQNLEEILTITERKWNDIDEKLDQIDILKDALSRVTNYINSNPFSMNALDQKLREQSVSNTNYVDENMHEINQRIDQQETNFDEKVGEITQQLNEINGQSEDNFQRLKSAIEDRMNQQQETIEQLQEALKHNMAIQKEKMIGSFFFSARCEDDIGGAVKCNGQKISIDQYPEFVEKYIKTGRIQSIPFDEWENQKSQNGRVSFFGYEQNKNEFITPFIPAGIYFSNPVESYISEGNVITPKQGDFADDQIVNITGCCHWANGYQGHTEICGFGGAFAPYSKVNMSYPAPCGKSLHPRGIQFDASKVVKTGDRVMPRTIFQNLYVIIQ